MICYISGLFVEKSLNVSSTEQDKPKSIISSGITQEELDTLKETTPSVIDEPLLQKLAAIEQVGV